MVLSSHLTPQPCVGVEGLAVLDEMVLVCPESNCALTLNASARAIWELCDGKRTLGDIIEVLRKRFDGGTTLEADLMNSVQRFHHLGFLEWNQSL